MSWPASIPVGHGDPLQVVIVTVCLDPVLCRQVVEAVDQMPWLVDISHLDSYSSATRRPAFGPQMKAAGRGVALIDYTQDLELALDCTRYLVQTFGSQLAVVAIGDDQTPDIILEAVRAGCREYLPSTGMRPLLKKTFARFAGNWSEREASTRQEGSVLALLGAKGGVGTTTLAVHLAVSLSKKHGKRVLLVDTQPELGHVCIHLGLTETHSTFADVVQNVNRLDSDLLQGFVGKHSSGLSVLSSPDVAGQLRALDPGAVAKTVEFLRSEFDYVVVDCDRSFTGVTQTILEAASRIYLIATPEMCALRDISRHLDRLLTNEQVAERLQIVLNRFTSRSGLNPEQIERNLRLSVSIRIPNDYATVVQAGNLGQPLKPDSKNEVAQAILRWSDSLVQIRQSESEAKIRRAVPLFGRLSAARLARKGAPA